MTKHVSASTRIGEVLDTCMDSIVKVIPSAVQVYSSMQSKRMTIYTSNNYGLPENDSFVLVQMRTQLVLSLQSPDVFDLTAPLKQGWYLPWSMGCRMDCRCPEDIDPP